MATAKIPESAQLSEAAEYRNNIYVDSLPRLQHAAWLAITEHNLRNNEFVVVCIQVDSRWRDIVDLLMPNVDWQRYRDTGQEPIARGSAMWSICKIVAERLPEIADVCLEVPPPGKVKAIVLSDGGGTIFELKPKAAETC